PDYKTCDIADPEVFARAADNYGYPTQADHYLDGVRALTGAIDPAFVFIAQEKTAPYLVSVFELDHVAMQIGAIRNRWARDIYAECTATGHWPAYVPDHEPHLLALPRWAEIREGVTR
ncbi:MAG: PD-(D/E)XK nuclease-like domain-containing protein, partial [Actinomycetota bacterium]